MTTPFQPGPRRLPRRLVAVWMTVWAFLFLLLSFPIQFRFVRLLILLCVGTIVIGGIVLSIPSRFGFRITLFGLMAAILVLAWPIHTIDQQLLRQQYVSRLQSYQGTRYVWGGETAWGIDCSGLMRRSLIDSILRATIISRNPGLLRTAFDVWWNDCTARDLSLGYGGRTVPIGTASSLNEFDASGLQPGDMAIVDDGIHVLACLGEKTWIEANSSSHRVIIDQVPDTNNVWLQKPAVIVRWSLLDESKRLASVAARNHSN